MIEVNIDRKTVEQLALDEIKQQLQQSDFGLVLWDKHELCRRTCMSWSTIQKVFFPHPDFPKVKIGGKWYFKAKQTEQFILDWLDGGENQ